MQKVHRFAPATDDWFVVYHIEEKRWVIERVVAWALMQADDETTDALAAFSGTGYISINEQYFYVKATDKSSAGRRWGEIYDDILPNGRDFREIADIELLAQLN